MAVQRIWLLTANPRDPATGGAVTTRLAGGGARGFTQFASTAWKAGLAQPPVIAQRLGFDDGQFGEGAIVQAFQITWGGRDVDAKSLAALYWKDQSFTLHSGPDGGTDGEMGLVIAGRIADATTAPGKIILQMADPAVDLAKPLITATFAGTGGIEGDPEIKGQAKWRAWGNNSNVTLRSLLKASNIWVCTDPSFPIQQFVQVRDRGNVASSLTLVNWAGSIAATLAALIAASAPAGGAAVAPSISCLKWWYANPGKLTCDILGEIGAGYVDRPADIAASMIAVAGGPAVSGAMLTAARAARNHEAGWLVSDTGATIASELTALLSGVSLWWALSAAGVVEMGPWEWGASVATFTAARIERVQTFRPVSKVSLGWKKNNTVMARGDIADVVLYGDVSGTPTTLAAVDPTADAKLAGIAALATRNDYYTSATDPGGANGSFWKDTSTTPNALKTKVAGSWVLIATYVNGTAQLADTANLGLTAVWAGITGTGKAADNATRNVVTYSASAPGSPVDGDLWVDISGTYAVFKLRVSGVWTTGANALSAYGALSGRPVALADINTTESSKLTGIEANADVTLLVTGGKTVAVAFDYTGASKGQLPLDANFKLVSGAGTDVTTAASWSATLKSGSATFTPTPASPNSTGILNVTGCTSSAVIEMKATYVGKARVDSLTVQRMQDDPPPSGGSGGGTSDSTPTITAVSSTSYGSANTRVLSAKAGSSGQVLCTFLSDFLRSTNGGPTDCFGKWQWRIVGGSFSDIAAEISSTNGAWKGGGTEPFNEPGSINVSMTKTGLTAGTTYEFQLLLRAVGAGALNYSSAASAVGS